MKTEMVMPQMGESIAEATILKWHKQVGDAVEQDETILEISTDKVDSEIPAPATGVITEILASEGDVVAVQEKIAVIDANGTAGASAPAKAAESKEEKPAEPAAPKQEAAPEQAASNDGKFYSPLVKSLAAQHGLSDAQLDSIKGTGANGRVNKADVLKFINGSAPAQQAPAAPAPATPAPAPVREDKPETQFGADGTFTEPMSRMRTLIADHMVKSKATSPHVYSVAEVDVTNIGKWRKQKQSQFLGREGFKLSYTPFFLEAVTKALVQFPEVNASVDGSNIVYKKDINLGCAVALGTKGLIVPCIKSADQLSLVGIARGLNDIAQRARSKKLTPSDTQGGTFTVTNPGIFGNTYGLPIINQPQLAILGIGAIKARPVVINGMIGIRDIVFLTLSYDHRVIDGSVSGQFLSYITKYLEGFDTKRELY